jgi:uncharacterized protein (DUF736 family)
MANSVRVGGLWINTPKWGGDKYLSGSIGKNVRVSCFCNTQKQAGSKAPDWRMVISRSYETDGERQHSNVEVSGLWKEQRGDVNVLVGSFGYCRIEILKNEDKKSENDPHYIMYFVEKERKGEDNGSDDLF